MHYFKIALIIFAVGFGVFGIINLVRQTNRFDHHRHKRLFLAGFIACLGVAVFLHLFA